MKDCPDARTSNQPMQPTARRRTAPIHFMKSHPFQATLAPPAGADLVLVRPMFFRAIVSFIALATVTVTHAVLPAEAERKSMGPGRPHASADLSIPNRLAVVLPPRKQKDE